MEENFFFQKNLFLVKYMFKYINELKKIFVWLLIDNYQMIDIQYRFLCLLIQFFWLYFYAYSMWFTKEFFPILLNNSHYSLIYLTLSIANNVWFVE